MNVVIEFSGFARSLVGTKEVSLSLETGSTYREIIQRLGELYPGLVGVFISSEENVLLSSNVFNLNGEEMVLPDALDASPQDGDRLILASFIVGG